MATFKRGEVAQYIRLGSPHYGEDVMVIYGPTDATIGRDRLHVLNIDDVCYGYFILMRDNCLCFAKPEWLRKKGLPPRAGDLDTKISWEKWRKSVEQWSSDKTEKV